MKSTLSEKWFYSINYVLLFAIGIGSVVPFLYIVSVSLTPLSEVMKHGGFLLWPRQVTFAAYSKVFMESAIPLAMWNTVIITVLGTAISVAVTILMGFGLAKKQVPGRNAVLFLVVFTMMFNGGIIPTYLVVKNLGMLNTLWALFIPTLMNAFNLLIAKAFMEQLPEELENASEIDGANEAGYLIRIVIPLSVPVTLTLGLFNVVFFWNTYFPGILYITDSRLYPLQVALQQFVAQSSDTAISDETQLPPETLTMAGVIISTLPIVVVYPFLQKYFIKGATIGAVKE